MSEHNPTVFIYPGQGSFEPGWPQKVIDTIPAAKKIFGEATEHASRVMKRDIGKLMLDGEAEDFMDTRLAQPATLISNITGSLALANIIGRQPDKRSGHSLGNIAAFHDDGVIDTKVAVDMAIERGDAMYQSQLERPGAMVAVFGEAEDRIIELCRKWGVHWANDNSHTEAILSGDEDGINGVIAELEEGGGKSVKLGVGVAAHAPHVAGAANRMNGYLEVIKKKIHLPERMSVVSSRTGKLLSNLPDVKADIAGLTDRVEWRNTIINLIDDGYIEFYETGPGSKLSRLPKRDPRMQAYLDSHGASMTSLDAQLKKIAA